MICAGLGVLISLAYLSVLRQQTVSAGVLSILAATTLLALVFDYRMLGRFLAVYAEHEAAERSHDLALRSALKATLKSPLLLKLLETELVTLFYAFFARFDPAGAPDKRTSFDYSGSSNAHDVYLFVAFSQLPFLPLIHVTLEHLKGPGPAWLVTVLTLWSVVWYRAQVEAVKFRPIEVGSECLEYRFGHIWSATIPLKKIETARLIDVGESLDGNDLFLSPLGSARNVMLEFATPIRFSGPYLLKRKSRKAAISIDDPARFLNELSRRGVATV